MNIAKKIGLDVEIFCRMVITTKMLFSNVLGHVAELHYEKYLKKKGIDFKKAPTDKHYDYIVKGERDQVKRFESMSTNKDFIGVNLVQTHGNRHGPDAFYKINSFDRLVAIDADFDDIIIVKVGDIPRNKKYKDRLVGRYKISREKKWKLTKFGLDFLNALNVKNYGFPDAIEKLRKKYNLSYKNLLEKCCRLSLKEIDSLFSNENFRLITGAKGFAAEEHFNVFLDKNKIPYEQDKGMYSKIDHWVGKKRVRVQVKIPNLRSTNKDHWGVKTHKSHGHKELELYKADEFDLIVLFVGFKMDESKSKYFPVSVKEQFIFIPVSDLERHPDYPDRLKRINKIKKDKYKINDISIIERFI